MLRTVADGGEFFVRVLNAARDTTRFSESKLIGGYEWCLAQEAVNATAKTVKLTLHWNCPPVGKHSCVANISFYVKRFLMEGRLHSNYGTTDQSEHNEVTFTSDSATCTTTLSVGDYVFPYIVAKVEVLTEVKPQSDFAAPTPRTDCVLKIGSRHVYLEKAALLRMSEYFRVLFSGKYVEGGHEVVSIDYVDPLEFLQVLQASEGSLQITSENVEGILRVADRFLVDRVLKQCDYFIQTSPMTLGEKLLLADRYSRKECFEKLLAFVRDSGHLKLISEDSKLSAELSRNGLEILYEVALKLGQAQGSAGYKPIF